MNKLENDVKRKLLEELMSMTQGLSGKRLPQKAKDMGEMCEEEEDEQDASLDPRIFDLIRKKKGF